MIRSSAGTAMAEVNHQTRNLNRFQLFEGSTVTPTSLRLVLTLHWQSGTDQPGPASCHHWHHDDTTSSSSSSTHWRCAQHTAVASVRFVLSAHGASGLQAACVSARLGASSACLVAHSHAAASGPSRLGRVRVRVRRAIADHWPRGAGPR